MPHPIMFSDDDPGLSELRAIALGFPGSSERVSHGRPTFFVSKMFVGYGGSSKVSRPSGHLAAAGDMVAFPHSMLVKVDQADRLALERDHRFYYPAYLGAAGWLGLDFAAAPVDWTEVGELVDASYRLVAPRTMIRTLDTQ